ncbi:DMT family transporter [Lentibacter sp. XHP0401]|jgi:drug/metabolite transporter (DMT)-like permease|uniref:DMT family transporter n=1 Tax=Lentibacter sp. XHP0401 TaxID=2984334 RepID=UPI0021E79DB9|nr:DMT family transporter [Lentibacter sp. XHP0401]MCV2891689.1 DMT family transporter [Lentibacter sp. XHP0401]
MNNLRGILLLTAAMAAFAVEDSFIKHLTLFLPRWQIFLCLGGASVVVFGLLARAQGVNVFARRYRTKIIFWRTLSDTVAASAFITALWLVPLSTVAAVFQATPLAITLGAALFMGEQVGWRRWAAIITGFIGVLIIIRPGLAGFDPSALFVLIAVAGIAARDLLTRLVPPNTSSMVVSFYGSSSFVLAVPLLMLSGEPFVSLTPTTGLYLAIGVFFGIIGYYMIVVAMRLGDASAIMPFRYTRLLFSIILGYIVFSESPDALTYAGSALIIASGLYTFLRERKLARGHAPASSAAV